ncbi:unnamed protein product, partial [Symbiodinium necroappetens]
SSVTVHGVRVWLRLQTDAAPVRTALLALRNTQAKWTDKRSRYNLRQQGRAAETKEDFAVPLDPVPKTSLRQLMLQLLLTASWVLSCDYSALVSHLRLSCISEMEQPNGLANHVGGSVLASATAAAPLCKRGRRPSNVLFFNCCLARAVIHLNLPGWETLFGFVDLQHISCELRKFHGDAAAVRAVPTRQEQRNYCQMVTAFAHHHNLPLPATGRSRKDSNSTTEWTDTQAEYLNFLEALIVRFKRLWVPRASATRLGATAILSDNRFRSKRIGQWTHLLSDFEQSPLNPAADEADLLLNAMTSVVLTCSARAAREHPWIDAA